MVYSNWINFGVSKEFRDLLSISFGCKHQSNEQRIHIINQWIDVWGSSKPKPWVFDIMLGNFEDFAVYHPDPQLPGSA